MFYNSYYVKCNQNNRYQNGSVLIENEQRERTIKTITIRHVLEMKKILFLIIPLLIGIVFALVSIANIFPSIAPYIFFWMKW